jgi:hypothetical protein
MSLLLRCLAFLCTLQEGWRWGVWGLRCGFGGSQMLLDSTVLRMRSERPPLAATPIKVLESVI